MPVNRIDILFNRFLAGVCTPSEKEELATLILSREQEQVVSDLLERAWGDTTERMTMPAADQHYHAILQQALVQQPAVHRMRFQRVRWWTAAAVLLLVATSAYLLIFHKKIPSDVLVDKNKAQELSAPNSNRAILTLADGRTVDLDSAANGQLAIQSNTRLVKRSNGQIAYENINNENRVDTRQNTLTNPRGSKVIDIMLSEGTHVWLNAGSTITFPVAFGSSDRQVSITGEAYFEVTRNPHSPFKVKAREVTVDVLGTYFNIRAYADEPYITTTLVQGAVRVSSLLPAGDRSALLQPGLQAVRGDQLFLTRQANLKQVLSWKNGLFMFGDMTLAEILREVSRWYDIDVEMHIPPDEAQYGGVLNRNSTLEKILRMLEKNGANHHFKLEGRKVLVLP